MEAETQDSNFPKFVYYIPYEWEQHYLCSIQMRISRFQYKIGKLTEVDRVTAYFKHAGIDPIMTMSLELFIREHWLVTN